MSDLIAQGPGASDRWRRQLPIDQPLVLGRTTVWAVPWDDRISRVHVQLVWDDHVLQVIKLPEAKNPLFYRGDDVTQAKLLPGDHFVIGNTTFTLAQERALVTMLAPEPQREQSFSRQELRQLRFRHADDRIDLLSQLPEKLADATGETAQFTCVVNMLLSGIARAEAAAVVELGDETIGEKDGLGRAVQILHWDRRLALQGDFLPSERLILAAMSAGKSVLHVWERAVSQSDSPFTMQHGVDWAFCTPIMSNHRATLGIYVAGSLAGGSPTNTSGAESTFAAESFGDDLKFTELVASQLGSVRQLQRLERQRAGLGQFFSPIVLSALADADAEQVLAPRETEVTVLFCDLRGFSRASEQSADNLLELLERVSQALGVTTRQICEQGGVLGDFHGDAVMGFWGWPLVTPDAAVRAARTALAIRDELASVSASPQTRFRAGIGIGTGMAVAGKIGTQDQVKVTVFGPVVNVAARLESMTEQLRATILLDERTAEILRRQLPVNAGRLRRVARVLPVGMEQPLMVSELLPPAGDAAVLSDSQLADYERALDQFLAGNWQAAFDLLHRVPAADRVKDFVTMHIVQHNRTPPRDWQGVISLASK